MTHRLLLAAAAALIALSAVAATPQDELRATFDRFVTAQNAHDLKAVEGLLLDSPQFLWITRGIPVWGRADALKKFGILYEGTWRLQPDPEAFKVVEIRGDMAQIFVPVVFTIGAPGEQARQALMYLNQTLIRTPAGWKIASILPVAVPTPKM